jgi:hypothetical protein
MVNNNFLKVIKMKMKVENDRNNKIPYNDNHIMKLQKEICPGCDKVNYDNQESGYCNKCYDDILKDAPFYQNYIKGYN